MLNVKFGTLGKRLYFSVKTGTNKRQEPPSDSFHRFQKKISIIFEKYNIKK